MQQTAHALRVAKPIVYVFIVVGALLQVVGVAVVFLEFRAIGRRVLRRDAHVHPPVVTANGETPALDPVAQLRMEMERGFQALRDDLESVRTQAHADVELVDQLARELATPHRWARFSAWAIIAGLFLSTIGALGS